MTYYCKNKLIQVISCSLIPVILEIPAFFYSYLPSSDCGAARSMFQIFQKTGTNANTISYFEFPNYFSLNEILHQIVGLDEKGIAIISFALYGILLSVFLYLVFYNLKKQSNYMIIPSLLVMIYFIGMYSLLNYQWVPQTLALVYFFLLLWISTYLLYNSSQSKWNLLLILVFTMLVYTHAFIPILFLVFFGVLVYKKRALSTVFLVIVSIYLVNTLYYTISNLDLYVYTLQQSIHGFGGEYTKTVTNSIVHKSNITIIDQIISTVNGIKLPLIWIIAGIGTVVLFVKRKINIFLIALGLSGGIYLAVGVFFSVLGLRATQILFIALLIGVMFFISKYKKLTLCMIIIILILAVFGPMRSAYNQTAFQIDEEAEACDFLANKIINVTNPQVAIDQVDWGYFTNKLTYLKNVDSDYSAIRPGSKGFLKVFNDSLYQNHYIVYNSNLGKEIMMYLMTKKELTDRFNIVMNNNKIFHSGTTFIFNGIKRT
jgi:hypothetical protein